MMLKMAWIQYLATFVTDGPLSPPSPPPLPPHTHIRPQVIEMLKMAWIQYLATFVTLWWFYSYLEIFIFYYRLVPTRWDRSRRSEQGMAGRRAEWGRGGGRGIAGRHGQAADKAGDQGCPISSCYYLWPSSQSSSPSAAASPPSQSKCPVPSSLEPPLPFNPLLPCRVYAESCQKTSSPIWYCSLIAPSPFLLSRVYAESCQTSSPSCRSSRRGVAAESGGARTLGITASMGQQGHQRGMRPAKQAGHTLLPQCISASLGGIRASSGQQGRTGVPPMGGKKAEMSVWVWSRSSSASSQSRDSAQR